MASQQTPALITEKAKMDLDQAEQQHSTKNPSIRSSTEWSNTTTLVDKADPTDRHIINADATEVESHEGQREDGEQAPVETAEHRASQSGDSSTVSVYHFPDLLPLHPHLPRPPPQPGLTSRSLSHPILCHNINANSPPPGTMAPAAATSQLERPGPEQSQ
jgi:hypothetical protein